MCASPVQSRGRRRGCCCARARALRPLPFEVAVRGVAVVVCVGGALRVCGRGRVVAVVFVIVVGVVVAAVVRRRCGADGVRCGCRCSCCGRSAFVGWFGRASSVCEACCWCESLWLGGCRRRLRAVVVTTAAVVVCCRCCCCRRCCRCGLASLPLRWLSSHAVVDAVVVVAVVVAAAGV